MKKVRLAILLWISCSTAMAEAKKIQNFLFLGGNGGNLQKYSKVITQHGFDGVQIVYTWKSLEPRKDHYDFSKIKSDLLIANKLHKKLFIQIQDRFFEPQAKYVPAYLLNNPTYGGGITMQLDNPGENKPLVTGWVASQWNTGVRFRYQQLIKSLADKFDGKIYGVNLPETAIDIDTKDTPTFSCDKYFDAELENIGIARKYFKHSYVVQYVNFFPCEWNDDHNYMNRLFQYALDNNIGLGGPDIVPYKNAQMKNSYQFFHKYKGKPVLVAMAVQEPTMTYINPKTKKHFTSEEFTKFASDYLGANIIFWNLSITSSLIKSTTFPKP